MADKPTTNVSKVSHSETPNSNPQRLRNTFSGDLKAVEGVLYLMFDAIEGNSARSAEDTYDSYLDISVAFHTVLDACDINGPEDFQQMKDDVLAEGRGVKERIEMVHIFWDIEDEGHPLWSNLDTPAGLMIEVERKCKRENDAQVGVGEEQKGTVGSSLSEEAHLRGGGGDDIEDHIHHGLGKQRTTFPQDLRHLDSLLRSTLEALPATPGPTKTAAADEEEEDMEPPLLFAFHIVLLGYDPRKPEDFQEMSDTAGLTMQHFIDLANKIRTKRGMSEGGIEREECYDSMNMSLVSLIRLMRIIEAMRDRGHPPPSFWLGDEPLSMEEDEEYNEDENYRARLRGGGSDDEPESHVDEALGKRRTTFPQDLKFLHGLLIALSHTLSTIDSWERDKDNRAILPAPLATMFSIFRRYDPRKPADFEQMKDTAGLGEKHFEDLATTIRRGRGMSDDGEKNKYEVDDYLNMDLAALSNAIGVIESMRDEGMDPPKFWLGDEVYYVGGADIAFSDDDSDEEVIQDMLKKRGRRDEMDTDSEEERIVRQTSRKGKSHEAGGTSTESTNKTAEDSSELHLRGGGHDDEAETPDWATIISAHNEGNPNLGKHRTTFPQDLKLLHAFLTALERSNTIGDWPHDENDRLIIPGPLDNILHIVSNGYDPRKKEDSQEMKDTAGFTSKHFGALYNKLSMQTKWSRDHRSTYLPWEEHARNIFVCRFMHFLYLMYVIETMRDRALEPMKLLEEWPGECECLANCRSGHFNG